MLKKLVAVFTVFVVSIYLFSGVYAAGNLLKNPSFEEAGQGSQPKNWNFETYNKDTGAVESKVVEGNAHEGTKCVYIANNKESDSRYIQEIKVKKGQKLKLSCWVKTEDVGKGSKGANISIGSHLETSKDIKGTNGKWENIEMYADIKDDVGVMNVTVGIGGYSNVNTGKAWIDDVSVEEVDKIPADAALTVMENPKADNSQQQGSQNSSDSKSSSTFLGLSKPVLIVLVIAIIIIGASLFMFFKKPSGSENSSETGDENESEDEDIAEDVDDEKENKKDEKSNPDDEDIE